MGKLWRRIYFLLHRRRIERELAEEMAAHREMMPDERRARFGNDLHLREESRDEWSWTWLEQVAQDVAYGARVLRKSPGFTLGAIAVLALGLGANLAEFQLFDAMILHRLTFRGVESCLQFAHGGKSGLRPGFPAGAVAVFQRESRTTSWLISEDPTVELAADGEPGQRTMFVSANYFGSLGIMPAYGRMLDAADSAAGAPLAVVLGHAYWQSRWAGDAAVVGRTIRVNDQLAQVVGVLPEDFEGFMHRRTALWFPLAARPVLTHQEVPPAEDFSRVTQALFGRAKPGLSAAAVDAEMTALTREIARQRPEAFEPGERTQSNPVQETLLRRIRQFPALAIFITIVLLVLLSACANLGNLLLARGLARQREIGIRLSIGASRGRVVRQLMTENLLLALGGAAAGLACGYGMTKALMYALGASGNFRVPFRPGLVACGLALAVGSAVVFGLPAALRTVAADHRRIRLRQKLVGVQVAVSCLLLIASAVLAHNGIASASIDAAFDYRNMIIVDPQFYARNLPESAAWEKARALSARFAGLPGVAAVTAALNPPFGGRSTIETERAGKLIFRNGVAESYFAAMNLPAVRGRTFRDGEENVVVVSESAARSLWPNQDPVGRSWRLKNADRTVIGVVKDSGANLLAHPDAVEAYLPLAKGDWAAAALIVHAREAPAMARSISQAALADHETVNVSLMRASHENALDAMRKMLTLFGALGALATGLAAAGMFALIAFAVAQRRKELSIRMAIGAGPANIVGILLRQNARAMTIGVAVGAVLAAILSQVARSMIALASKSTVDAIGFAAGIAAFVVVAALATLTPALRALRIDPAATLREE
jgi:predicted permease